MIYNWIKIAFRSYRKNIFFTMVNVLGLSIGMVGIILVTLYWNDELRYDQWNPHKNEIYAVVHEFNWSGKKNFEAISTIPEGPTIQENFSEVEDFLACSWLRNGIVKTESKSMYLKGYLAVSKNFFEFFPFEFLHGSASNSLADLESIVISEDWMNQLYDGANPVGEKIILNKKEYLIKGVYRIPDASSVAPKALIAMDWIKVMKENENNWMTYQLGIYLKLKQGTDSEVLAKKIQQDIIVKKAIEPFAEKLNITVEQYIEDRGDANTTLERLGTIRLFGKAIAPGSIEKGNLTMLYILSGLSLVILVLSVFNYVNFTTASSVKRAKEVGVRKALGASRFEIVCQFILENFLVCIFSLLLAVTLTEIILPHFNAYFEKELTINFGEIFFDSMVILVSTTLISSLIPAFYLSNFQTLKVLKGNFSRSRNGIWIRNTMLGLQFLISLFFMIVGVVIYLQVKFMANKELGFNGDQIIVVDFHGGNSYKKYKLAQQELKRIPGVMDISAGFQVPAMANYVGGKLEHSKTGQSVDLALSGAMDYNFVDVLHLEITEGRNLSESYALDTISNVLINETLAKQLNLTNPLGEEIYYGSADKTFKIIGVVKDYFVKSFETKIEPTVYFHWNTVPWTKEMMNHMLLKVDTEQLSTTLDELEKQWKSAIEPEGYPFDYHFVDQEFANTYKEYTRQQQLFEILMVVVISIALLGLFGLISLIIEQRMKEISIRKVLGASQKDVVQLIGKQYLILVILAFIICVPITYYLIQKWLENFAYRIEIPIWPFVLPCCILFFMVFIIIAVRARYAMKTKPIKYLKYE